MSYSFMITYRKASEAIWTIPHTYRQCKIGDMTAGDIILWGYFFWLSAVSQWVSEWMEVTFREPDKAVFSLAMCWWYLPRVSHIKSLPGPYHTVIKSPNYSMAKLTPILSADYILPPIAPISLISSLSLSPVPDKGAHQDVTFTEITKFGRKNQSLAPWIFCGYRWEYPFR